MHETRSASNANPIHVKTSEHNQQEEKRKEQIVSKLCGMMLNRSKT
jgi:hypothetical protein